MLHRDGDFEEYQLARAAREYIEFYARPGNNICFVPYFDVPSKKKKFIKFVYEEATGWIYVDNSQFAK